MGLRPFTALIGLCFVVVVRRFNTDSTHYEMTGNTGYKQHHADDQPVHRVLHDFPIDQLHAVASSLRD